MGNEIKGEICKIIINGQEICDVDYDVSPHIIQEGGIIPEIINNMQPTTGEFTFKLSWWSGVKLRWFFFKHKYFSRENVYTIKFGKRDE